MHRYLRLWIVALSVFGWLLIAQGTTAAKLIPPHDPRTGVLDASLVVIVRQELKDWFRVEETFLGDQQAGELVHLPDFKLTILKSDEPDVVEPITLDTRILLFLQRKKDEPGGWEVTYFGHCYFWVQHPEKVEELRKMARDAVALRRDWEAARDIPDERKRVEALWQYLWNNNHFFHRRTKEELKKVGGVAGDYIAEQWERLDSNQLGYLVGDIGEYGSQQSHNVLLAHLRRWQQTYEMYLEKQGAEAKTLIDDWNKTPIEIKDIYGELYYGLAGLSSFKDSSDLPYIRELTSWAVKYRFKQVCDAALGAFREMPEKENLPVIEAIWNEYSVHQMKGNELQSYDVVRALEKHHYPEAIPFLVKFLNDSFVDNAAKNALVELVGKDLGKEPGAWLKWYKAQKGKEEK